MNKFYFVVVILGITTFEVSAQVRKCLDDKDCYQDECCAQAFYLFRCEKRGFNDGDRCGLCGCRNGLTCVSEGINPFKVLSGRGHCRYQPHEVTPLRPVPLPLPSPALPVSNCSHNVLPQDKVDHEPEGPVNRPVFVRPARPTKPGKDHFYETFRPIYEQFVQLAASVAGIDLNDTLDNSTD